MYAILDIETTGGKYNEEGITEIAIYQHDGLQVTDQFISLINPERAIQPFVEKLTGINGQMLRSAPRFFEVAKRIIEITKNCLIVAHNTDLTTASSEPNSSDWDTTLRETPSVPFPCPKNYCRGWSPTNWANSFAP